MWTDKNRSFRIRWFHISFTTSITFPSFNVFYRRAKTVWISYVWTRIFLKMEQKDLRFQKYPDTCGRDLCCGASTLICSKLTFEIYCNERIRWFGTPTRGKSGNGKGFWAELTFTKTSGTVTKDWEKTRPFAQWHHFSTTTRMLFAFSFIFKFGNPSEV